MVNKDLLEKTAALMAEMNKATQKATKLANQLLHDNEELQEKVASLEAEKHAAERDKKIEKIAQMLNKNGLIPKSDINNKIAQLKDAGDDFLDDYMKELSNLHGNTMPKEAGDNFFSTLSFMDPDINKTGAESEDKETFLSALSK